MIDVIGLLHGVIGLLHGVTAFSACTLETVRDVGCMPNQWKLPPTSQRKNKQLNSKDKTTQHHYYYKGGNEESDRRFHVVKLLTTALAVLIFLCSGINIRIAFTVKRCVSAQKP